ncbi:hypothetical protein HYR99_05285 [Candidatus Poribacteria bacterium]|nr:hypothetical protein [Candidatus Poribacteria bacterium]
MINPESALNGEWKTLQGVHSRTGRAEMGGQIRNPQVVWSLDTASSELYFVVNASNRSGQFVFETDKVDEWNSDMEEQWGLRVAKIDVCGDGVRHDISQTPPLEIWGKFLPQVPGYQKIRFTNTWTSTGQANLELHSYEHGLDLPTTVWRVKFEPEAQAPLPIVVDVDADGQLEIAVSHWFGVTIYDLRTGAMKYQNMYREYAYNRQYGHFSAVALPNGRVARLVVGTYVGHIGMLMVREGKLELLWFYGIYKADTPCWTINPIGPEPADDFDGDGEVEVLMNYFNPPASPPPSTAGSREDAPGPPAGGGVMGEMSPAGGEREGDNRWHLMGYDALTGRVKYDIEDFFLDGAVDVDGDGRKEWLGRSCNNRATNTHAPLRILKPTGANHVQEIWRCPYGRWSLRRVLPTQTLRVSSGCPVGATLKPVSIKSRPGDGEVVFFSEPGMRETNHEKLKALSLNSGKPLILWTIEAPPDGRLEAISAGTEGTLVRLEQPPTPTAQMSTLYASLNPIGRRPRLVRIAPQVVALNDSEGKPHLIVATSTWHIRCFQPGAAVKGSLPSQHPALLSQPEPQLLWAYPGRPMCYYFNLMFGLEAGDIDGDGGSEVLYVTEGPNGGSRLIAQGTNGTIRWHHDFPGFNGYAAEWNDGMTTFWAVGPFIRPERLDVFVNNRRSVSGTGESVVVDVRENRIAWHRHRLQLGDYTHGSYGGYLPAFADFDTDSLDEIVHTYGLASIVNGDDGEQLFAESVAGLGSGAPLIADLDGDGTLEILVTHPHVFAVLKRRNQHLDILWRTEPGDGPSWPYSLPALADTDGDGRFELGAPGFRDGFRCFNPSTGHVLWNIEGSASSNCVACDIDADGREEFLYADGTVMKAVRNGEVVWQMELPASVIQLALADVDGDGASEVLASSQDGRLYCVDENRQLTIGN